jgi:hypothetical protein
MPKFDFGVAIAFATQTAEGTYNATLDAITTSLSYTQGLVLGDASAGVNKSGLSLGIGRRKEDKAFIGSTFTKPISNFLAAEVPTFTFTMPFCGPRSNAASPPVAANATPIVGLDALLEGMGLTGASWGSGTGWQYVYGSTLPISALIYYFGNRLELLDCRVSGSIVFEPKSYPKLTATVEVGSVKDHSLPGYSVPATLTYGAQASESAPVIQAVNNTWREARGFSSATLSITPTYESIGDSNAITGEVKEQTDRETVFTATIFADDTTDEGHEYEQVTADAEGTLDQLSFLVGDAMTAGNPAKAVGIVMPYPEATEATIAALGTKAAHEISLSARGYSLGSGNDELEINFQ